MLLIRNLAAKWAGNSAINTISFFHFLLVLFVRKASCDVSLIFPGIRRNNQGEMLLRRQVLIVKPTMLLQQEEEEGPGMDTQRISGRRPLKPPVFHLLDTVKLLQLTEQFWCTSSP